MKNIFFALSILAVYSINAQVINIPDQNFKNKLLQSNIGVPIAMNASGVYFKIDGDGDLEIDQNEALSVEKLYIGSSNISNISGIEYFTNLKTFNCNINLLTSVNLSTLNQLTYLVLDNNNLSTINFTGLSSLKFLYCQHNQINFIDLSGLPNLNYLAISSNLLSSLNVSTNLELKYLGLEYNQISSLDLSSNQILTYLSCGNNLLTELNVNSNGGLQRVLCQNNQITSLDFSNNHYFAHLSCNNNNLTSLNIQNNAIEDVSNGANSFNDCWKTGNSNLTNVCADASEVAAVQSFLNGCGDVTQIVNVVSNCSMGNEEFGINEIKVFPNPTNSTININGNSSIKTIELYDIQGRVLVTKEVNANQTNLDISGYSNGVYFIKITTDAGVKLEKVIKE